MVRLVNLIPLVLVYINRKVPANAGTFCRKNFLPIMLFLWYNKKGYNLFYFVHQPGDISDMYRGRMADVPS